MSSREKFEQAIKARFGDSIDYRVCKNSDGEYMAWDMQVAWWAWQAAETDMAVQLANAESKCRELAEFKSRIYAQMGAGCEAPEFSITEGLSNLRRFADTLHAIEREFFTKEVPDEECEGETVEECPLCWGMTVEQYVSEFGKCLAEVRAQAHKEGAHFVANRMLAAWDAGFIDDTAKNAADIARMILTSTEFMTDAPEGDFDRSFADGVLEDIATQIRKGAAL